MTRAPEQIPAAADPALLRSRAGGTAVLIGLIAVAANLRPLLSSVSPMIAPIAADLHLSAPMVTVTETLPVVCLGAFAPLAPWLARRWGLHRAVLVAIVLVTVGLVVRLGPDTATLLTGSVVGAAGIAIGNVLLPAVVKRDFSRRTGPATSLYTSALATLAAVAAGVTVPIGHALGLGWRGALGVWAVPALVACALWFPHSHEDVVDAAAVDPLVPERRPDRPARPARPSIVRIGLAWQVAAFMGLQSLGFYAVLSWLPSIYRDRGIDATTAGLLLSVTMLIGAPVSLVVPTLVTRMRSQRIPVVVVTGLAATGLLGLLLSGTHLPYLWTVLIGLGQGASFPLALTLIVLRTRDATDTAHLSTLAQTVGYLVAALGPLGMGALHQATGGWTAPIVLLLVLLVPMLAAGLGAARPRLLRE